MRRLPAACLLLLAAACSRGWNDKGDHPEGQDGGASVSDTALPDDTGAGGETGAGDDTGSGEVDADGDGWTVGDGDCDDGDAAVHPGAEEVCDGVDDDCDGSLLSGEATDGDADGVLDCEDFCPIQVDASAPSGGDGSFAAPFQRIQDGIDAVPATGCAQVEVHPGTYEENVDYGGIDAEVYSSDGPEATVIDGGAAGSVVTFATAETAAAVLEGFTVRNGLAERGGGIHVDGASPTIRDNIVADNATTEGGLGGGLYLYDSDAEVTGNAIRGNDACIGGPDTGCDGGGIAILYGSPLVRDNEVRDNTAGDGGGIWVAHGEAILANLLVDGNAADDQGFSDDLGNVLYGQGGGVDFQADTAGVLLVASVITNNTASSHGGGIGIIGFYEDSAVAEPTVENVAVAFNATGLADDAGGCGAGVCVWGLSAPSLVNALVAWNDGSGLASQYAYEDQRYCDVYGNGDDYAGAAPERTGSDGNLSEDPLLAGVTDDGDPDDDDFRPASGSPLVDAGDPSLTDTDGTRSDIGAYGGAYGGW